MIKANKIIKSNTTTFSFCHSQNACEFFGFVRVFRAFLGELAAKVCVPYFIWLHSIKRGCAKNSKRLLCSSISLFERTELFLAGVSFFMV